MQNEAEPNSALLEQKERTISKADYLAMLMRMNPLTKNEIAIHEYQHKRERQASYERSRHC